MHLRNSSVEIYLLKYMLQHFKISCCASYNVLVIFLFYSLHPSTSEPPKNILHLPSCLFFYNSLSPIIDIHMQICMGGVIQWKISNLPVATSPKEKCLSLPQGMSTTINSSARIGSLGAPFSLCMSSSYFLQLLSLY